MSKERLEELKKMRLLYEVCFVDEYASAIDDVTVDFDLLIKRVQELEETNKKNYWIASDFKFENLKLEQQNKRYREALDGMRLHAHYPDIIKQIYEEVEESDGMQDIIDATEDRDTLKIVVDEQNESISRLLSVMESALSEIRDALYSNKSKDVKEHYLRNAERFIEEALECDSE